MGFLDVNIQITTGKSKEKIDETEMNSSQASETALGSKSRVKRSPITMFGLITTSIIGVLAVRRLRNRRSKRE